MAAEPITVKDKRRNLEPSSAGAEHRGAAYYLSYARSIVFTDLLIYLYTVVCGTFSILGSFFDTDGRWQHFWARTWSWLILKSSGVRVRVEGLEHFDPERNAVYCVNHPSAMDIPILFVNLPIQFRFLAKHELFNWPFLGWHLRRSGHISVRRGRPREALKSFEEAAAKVRSGVPVVTFPEGTRSRTGEMLPFKAGSFYLAILAGVPVVPITLNGTRYVHEPHKYHVRAGQTEMIIHEPIPTEGMNVHDADKLSDQVRDKISSRIRPLRGKI